mgnify:CR=1 FL=1
MSFTSVMAGLGAAVSVLLGALYTAYAALGGYYMYLYHLSRGRRVFSRPPVGR